MSELLIYNPEQDKLGVLIPLYTRQVEQTLDVFKGYTIGITSDKPVAYIIGVDGSTFTLISAEFVKKKFDVGIINIIGEV